MNCGQFDAAFFAVMQPVKMPTRPYPMSKIVGQDMVKLALLLAAGDMETAGHVVDCRTRMTGCLRVLFVDR